MKTVNSGIIRRIDDIGRIYIPKEMRRLANIKEGDPLEVGFANGCIVLEKYTGEFDEETGLPIPMPQNNNITDVKAVNREPQKYYVDVCDRRVFTTLEGIINVMEANGDITTFEEFLCQEYTASALYEMYATHGIEQVENKLDQEYMEYAKNQAQDLLDNLRDTNYIEVYI